MSLVKSLAGQTVIYGMGHILPRILHFVVFNTYLTYKWNHIRTEYAIYLDLYAYASLLLIVFSYRMDTAMFRFGRRPEDLENTYGTAVIPLFFSSAMLVILGFLFADPLVNFLTYPGKSYYVEWFSLIIAFDVLALLPYAKYRLQNRAITFIKYKIANVILTVLLVLCFLEAMPRFYPDFRDNLPFIQSDVDLVFLSNLIASAVICFLLLGRNWPITWKVDWMLWRKMAWYALPLIIVGAAGSINQFFAVPLQKFFLGAEIEINKDQAAVYGAAQKIAALLALFTTAYNYAAEPFFFRHSEDKDARKLYGQIALFFVLAAGVISLGIYYFIDIFQWIIGSRFREGLYLIPILLMAYLFLGIYYNVSIWYKLSDQTKYGALIASVGSVITLGGSICLLPVMGIDASAWVALTCYATMVILAYWIGQHKYPIDYPARRMILHLTIIVIFFIGGYYSKTDSVLVNMFWAVLLMIGYLAIILRIEKRRIKQYIFSRD